MRSISRLLAGLMTCSLGLALPALASEPALAPAADLPFEMGFARIGNPRNAPDTLEMDDGTSGWGSVAYEFEIGSREVTNLQYVVFLNEVATVQDPHGLWDPGMCPVPGDKDNCTIRKEDTGYLIQPASGDQPKPVAFVDIYDAMRFANWLHNRSTGSSGTEDGAYTIPAGELRGQPIPKRNPGARYFLPSEDEWYKAAYYDAAAKRYFLFPTGSDAEPTCGSDANCENPDGEAVENGGSVSPYGTSAQGGNVREWTERENEFGYVTLRGGGFNDLVSTLRASSNFGGEQPTYGESRFAGFRIARAVEASPPKEACEDGLDNDGDGLTDHPDDPGCAAATDGSEREPNLPCDDGIDNDGDGWTDYPGDSDCRSPSWGSEGPPPPQGACADGVDNDEDGSTDYPEDPGCASATDASERDPALVCDDGVDNDGDGWTDYPGDTDCTSPSWGDEGGVGHATLRGAIYKVKRNGALKKARNAVVRADPYTHAVVRRDKGRYELTLPAGSYWLTASMKKRACLVGAADGPSATELQLAPGETRTVDLYCVR